MLQLCDASGFRIKLKRLCTGLCEYQTRHRPEPKQHKMSKTEREGARNPESKIHNFYRKTDKDIRIYLAGGL